ncbi:MAG: galactose-1-phosphate uridylyltransferase [Thermoplasmata archaeon]
MPELRKDYVTDTWVVFAPARAQRPIDTQGAVSLDDSAATCPFCPGHEHMTPPEILAYRSGGSDGSSWQVRCIPNQFPALTPEGELRAQVSDLFHAMEGVGAHEIIIETPDHAKDFSDLSKRQIQEVLRAYTARSTDLAKDTRLTYVLIFKNHGAEAGASLFHTHSQLIATPIVPRRIQDELRGAEAFHGERGVCIYDGILEEELDASERVVSVNEDFVALCPYASRFPFEIWILPRRHRPRFEEISARERRSMAELLRDTLRKLDTLVQNPPFNWYIHTSPSDGEDHPYYHWHLEITPRLSKRAGFERGTGFYINSVPPEDAARLLRQAGET